jgi:hypothetical protein
MANPSAIADALTAALTAAGFPATRVWTVAQEVTALADFTYSVTIRGNAREVAARNIDRQTVGLSIIVQKAADPATPSTVDDVVNKAEAIAALFGTNGSLRTAKMAGAHWNGTLAYDPILIPEHLAAFRTATSVLTLEYQIEA